VGMVKQEMDEYKQKYENVSAKNEKLKKEVKFIKLNILNIVR
jgi:hypothetical protein